MDIEWLDPQRLDRRTVDGLVSMQAAVSTADAPHQLTPLVSQFKSRIRHGHDGEPPLVAVASEYGRVLAGLWLGLPRWDNTHLANVYVAVDPRERRRGWGRALFDAGVERARAEGRRLVCAAGLDRPAVPAFMQAMGLKLVYEEVLRRLDVRSVNWAGLNAEYTVAHSRAAGYELLRVPGAAPEELLPQIVTMTGATNDAPTGQLEIEDEVFSAERIRAYEQAQAAYGRRLYRVIARDRATGELAGYTMVAVGREQPWYAGQHDTAVVRAHRGHRLGLLLKIDMLRWLREEEPQLRAIDTGNAADNAHMIRINDLLGFTVLAVQREWQRHL